MKNVNACVNENFEFLESDDQEIITSLAVEMQYRSHSADTKGLVLKNIGEKLEKLGTVKCTDFIMIFKNH